MSIIMQKVLAVSNGREVMYFEQDEQLARCEKLMFGKRIMEVLPYRAFNTLRQNSTNAEIRMPKHYKNLLKAGNEMRQSIVTGQTILLSSKNTGDAGKSILSCESRSNIRARDMYNS